MDELLEGVDTFEVVDPMVIEYHRELGFEATWGGKAMLVESKLALSSECLPEMLKDLIPIVKAFRKVYQPFNRGEYAISQSQGNLMDHDKVLMTMEEFERVDKASRVLVLISGETPTYLNVWYDIVLIRIRLSEKPDPIIIASLKHLSLVNQKYRKSSKSWHLRQCLIR